MCSELTNLHIVTGNPDFQRISSAFHHFVFPSALTSMSKIVTDTMAYGKGSCLKSVVTPTSCSFELLTGDSAPCVGRSQEEEEEEEDWRGRAAQTRGDAMMTAWRVAVLALLLAACTHAIKRREDKTKCPHVRPIRNFDLHELLGRWFVVQYYASSEEAVEYRCMRAELSVSPSRLEVSMNFSYTFNDDPAAEVLYGNITWEIPNPGRSSHWVHAEDTYEGIYNTYVLDSDYRSWALLLHCAEKSRSPRYLSSFIMSREPNLGLNVVSYLREKLPRYDIDLDFMFPMSQKNCTTPAPSITTGKSKRRHPLKRLQRNT